MGLNRNLKIEAYLSSICSRIKFREAHRQIRLELESHIKETAAEYISQGIPEDEAVNRAISQMGDAAHIGQKLNQIHKPRPEWSILTLTLLFVSLGLTALFFIQSTAVAVQYPIFEKSLLFTIMTPSVAAAAIYLAAAIALMLVSGIKPRSVLLGIASGVGVLLFSILTAPYRLARFTGFINPNSDPGGSGYLYLQLKQAITTSGMFGQGFTLQPHTIPELHTNFIFTYITYTFGWIASLIVAALIILFLVRMVRVAIVVKTNYAKLVISGFVAIFAAQFVWNILMNVGFAPISGVGLPFISYGGSQFMMNMAAVGLISSIYRRKFLTKLT